MTMMTGGEALMQILRAEGVEYVFGMPGSSETYFMDALEDHPEIKYIHALHESASASMAIGYALASGKPGVLNLHTSVGIGAAMPTLLGAQVLAARGGGVPLVVTAGEGDVRTRIQEGAFSGDLTGLSGQFAKWSTEVSYAHDFGIIMRRAFKVATQAPTGPVFVAIPQAILAESMEFKYTPNVHLSRRRPDQESIERAAELLVKAQAPIIVVGNGISKHQAESEVVELAELVGAYVYPSAAGDVNFPTTHPQYLAELPAQNIGQFLQSMDVLAVVGCPAPATTSKLIQIDNDPWEIGKNQSVDAGIEGDIKLSLADLNRVLQEKLTDEARQAARARIEKMANEKQKRVEAWLKDAQKERDNVPISVSRLAQEIAAACKPKTVIVDESWSHRTSLFRYIDFTEPKTLFRSRGGSIGQGIPLALGVKLALPDRPVLAVVGDGSAVWSIQSLWTAATYNIPVTWVILANAGYRTVKMGKIRLMGEQVRGRFLGLDLKPPKIDFCHLAQGMGVQGQKVERPDELKEALKAALESGKPALVEVVINDTV